VHRWGPPLRTAMDSRSGRADPDCLRVPRSGAMISAGVPEAHPDQSAAEAVVKASVSCPILHYIRTC